MSHKIFISLPFCCSIGELCEFQRNVLIESSKVMSPLSRELKKKIVEEVWDFVNADFQLELAQIAFCFIMIGPMAILAFICQMYSKMGLSEKHISTRH